MKSFQHTILLSSYRCDPFGISESSTAFRWLEILLRGFNIILLTTEAAEKSISKYYEYNLPENLKIISFGDNYPFKNKKVIRDGIKLGYFFFNFKITKFLKKHPEVILKCNIIFQKTPETYRFFTSLVKFNKPVYIGPLSGGLKPPLVLKDYFKKEPLLFRLRVFDSILFKLPPYKSQFEKVEKVIMCFDYLKHVLPEKYLSKEKILPNSAIDCSQYAQAVLNNTKTPSILYVGRLTRYKGAELLIRALNNLRNADFLLNIVGDGEERSYLEGIVKEFKLGDKIIFHGFKKKEEVKSFYQAASIFCFPTLTEAVGIVFYEAMASGLPIITIDNGGPKYICPSKGSIKIPLASAEEIIKNLTDSIRFLLYNPQTAENMGKYNRNYCLEKYDWKILEQDVLNFFRNEIEFHSTIN